MSENDPTDRRNTASQEREDEYELLPGDFVRIAKDFSFFGVNTVDMNQQLEEEGIDLNETYCLVRIMPGDEMTEMTPVAYIARRDAPELGEFIESFKHIHELVDIDPVYKDRLFYVPDYVLERAPQTSLS